MTEQTTTKRPRRMAREMGDPCLRHPLGLECGEMEMDGEQPVRIARPETGVELSLRSHHTVRALIRPTSKGTGSPPHP